MRRYAVISVHDKSRIAEFGRFLYERGYVLLASGGTSKELVGGGLPVTDISDYTGMEEMFGGRVKTLHPKITAGLLARDLQEDEEKLLELQWNRIDCVVVNFYPFADVIARPGTTFAEAIENIDIGGPTLVRSAAKNWKKTLVVTSPDEYDYVSQGIAQDGSSSDFLRLQQMKRAFRYTAKYDATIDGYLQSNHPG